MEKNELQSPTATENKSLNVYKRKSDLYGVYFCTGATRLCYSAVISQLDLHSSDCVLSLGRTSNLHWALMDQDDTKPSRTKTGRLITAPIQALEMSLKWTLMLTCKGKKKRTGPHLYSTNATHAYVARWLRSWVQIPELSKTLNPQLLGCIRKGDKWDERW